MYSIRKILSIGVRYSDPNSTPINIAAVSCSGWVHVGWGRIGHKVMGKLGRTWVGGWHGAWPWCGDYYLDW